MADNENLNTEAIEPVEVVHDLSVERSLLGATLGATATEQEPDEEFETIPVAELVEVKLGRQGENDTQTVVIDCSVWLEKLPGCTFMIAATRPGEREIYLPEVTVENGVVTWPIMEQDTACAGAGRAEVRAMKDGKIKKSALFRTRIEPALEGDGSPDAPTPPNWVKLIIGSVEEAQASVERSEDLIEEATACAINAVRFDEAQGLTDEQKNTAQVNIGLESVLLSNGDLTVSKYAALSRVVKPGIYNSDVIDYEDNPCPGSNGLLIVMQRSTNWNVQIYLPTVRRTDYTGDKTAYYRIVNRNDYSTLLNWTPFVDLSQIEVDVAKENLIKVAQTCTAEDLTIGVISSTGEVDPNGHANRRCTQTYFKVSKGDMIFMTNDDVWMAICSYDENKNRIKGTEYYSRKPVEASNHTYTNQTTYRPFVVYHDGYVRMHFRRAESSSSIPDLEDVVGSFVIVSQTDPLNAVALDEYAGKSTIQSRKPVRLDGSLIYGQDGTFVKGKLWSFDDGYSSVGNISVIDVESGTATTRTHDLGHANVVDYNPNNDCLMMFGTQNSHPAIVLYKDPEGATDLRKADAACTIIELYNSSGMLNGSASVCWGEADCIAYYMTGVYADSSQAIAPTREIYKLLLGMGSNDLSADGGLGTFISGKAANEYNGTAKILKTYTGEIPFRFTRFSTGNLETPQGMEYDGCLYVGWGFSGHNVLKIALNDDSNGYTVVDNYWVDVLNNDGTSAWYEPEMVALNGPYLYTGSRTGTNKLFLRLDR